MQRNLAVNKGVTLLKRLFDIIISFIGLLLLCPFLITISIIIKATSPGTVFYRGVRVGKKGKLFRIYKFRTMVMDAEKIGPASTASDDPRITKIGHFLRRYKLDELPQLINVFLGAMSFVGPRPEVQKWVDKYTEEEKIILDLRPGITDYASLRFPNENEILKMHKDEFPDADDAYGVYIRPEKIRLQMEYARHHNVFIDLKIIFNTIKAVLSKTKWN